MPRDLTPEQLDSLRAQDTDELHLVVLEIDHASLPTPLRFVRNNEALTHDAVDYEPAWFELPMVRESPGDIPEVTLDIDIVDRVLLDAALSLTTPATVTFGTIMVGQPGYTSGPYRFKWRETRYTATRMQAVLGTTDLLNAPDQEHEFTPSLYPGLFR